MNANSATQFATAVRVGQYRANPNGQRRLAIWLALAVLCAQLLLAWHSPSHILADEHGSKTELLASADCQVCTHGHGLLALPSLYFTPVSAHAEPAPLPPSIPQLAHTIRVRHLPRGPPASA